MTFTHSYTHTDTHTHSYTHAHTHFLLPVETRRVERARVSLVRVQREDGGRGATVEGEGEDEIQKDEEIRMPKGVVVIDTPEWEAREEGEEGGEREERVVEEEMQQMQQLQHEVQQENERTRERERAREIAAKAEEKEGKKEAVEEKENMCSDKEERGRRAAEKRAAFLLQAAGISSCPPLTSPTPPATVLICGMLTAAGMAKVAVAVHSVVVVDDGVETGV